MLALGVPTLAAGLAAALIGAVMPAQAAAAVHYVSLGDSYSSGVGAGGAAGSCARSPHAYPALWAAAHPGVSFAFAACSGARTTDVINNQLSSLSSSTTLVSITIGGNDVGFSSIMQTCVLDSTSACESAVTAAEKIARTTLQGKLNTTLAGIRAAAPNAKVIVLDYPDFYDLGAWFCIGLSSADHHALDSGIDILDGVIKQAALANGDAFADVRSAFSGHELCDWNGWLHSLTWPIGNSYHPTVAGHQDGYLPVFSAAASKAGQ